MADQESSLQKQDYNAKIQQFWDLVQRTNKQNPRKDDVAALKRMLHEHPEFWSMAGDLANVAAGYLLEMTPMSFVIKESAQRGQWEIMKDLGYQTAPRLERLLIEQVALCWMRLNLIEHEYTFMMRQSIPLAQADHWEKRLSAAQRRYLQACETLARIRKLARKNPALQVNIATNGGQQVNAVLVKDNGGDVGSCNNLRSNE